MIRTLFFFIVFWLYQLAITPFLLLTTLFYYTRWRSGALHIARLMSRIWARSLVWVSGARVTVHGQTNVPQKQPALFVSNHQGAFDIPLLLTYLGRPVGFVAKKELKKIPLVSAWMKYIGCLFLDRSDRRSSLETVKQAIEYLQGTISLVIFPEGTRSNGPDMRPFKKGSLSIGIKAGVPIVPVTVKNTYRLKKGDTPYIQAADVEIFIHDPIDPTTLDKQQVDTLAETVENIVASPLKNEHLA